MINHFENHRLETQQQRKKQIFFAPGVVLLFWSGSSRRVSPFESADTILALMATHTYSLTSAAGQRMRHSHPNQRRRQRSTASRCSLSDLAVRTNASWMTPKPAASLFASRPATPSPPPCAPGGFPGLDGGVKERRQRGPPPCC